MKWKKDKRWWWIWLGAGALGIRLVLNYFPGATEVIYSRGIFPGIRYLFDYTICLLPLPLFYILFLLLLVSAARYFRKAWVNRKTGRPFSKMKSALLSTAAFSGAVIFLFLLFWGFNYARLPLEQQLGLNPLPLDSAEVKKEVDFYTLKAAEYRKLIPGIDTSAITEAFLPENLENLVRKDLENILSTLEFPTSGRVRGRKLIPPGILMRFGVAGVYIPFIGEGHIDSGLHPITHPYTMAHEMAHGYGFTDEGTCNFLALIACSGSSDPVIKYSGYLSHSRDVLVAYRRVIWDKYPAFRKTLDPGLVADMDAINEANARFGEDWLPGASINNLYLKAQGISEGILSYSRVVTLAKAWREKEK